VGGDIKYNVDGRFVPTNFAKMCLVDAGVACDDAANSDPLDKTNATKACCSCFLYTRHCAGVPSGRFVTAGSSDHILLMPSGPCTGVENWDRLPCPKEAIWDQGLAEIKNAGKDPSSWGMSINPVSRRGQHQMHVHLGEVQLNVAKAISTGFHQMNKTDFYLDCGLDNNKRTLEKCVVHTSGSIDRYNPHVQIKHKINNPSELAPFSTVYGGSSKLNNDNVLWASMLVIKVFNAPNTWALVTNHAGPAECFLKNNGEGACSNSP